MASGFGATDAGSELGALSAISINNSNFVAAVGYAQSTSTVAASITGDMTITAAEDVAITATGTSTIVNSAIAPPINATKNPNIVATAVDVSYNDLNVTATIGDDVTITSGGAVNILATGVQSTSTEAETKTYAATTAGATAEVGVDEATVLADANGHITASGSAVANDFNGGTAPTVDYSTGQIVMPGNTLQTGDIVTYNAGPGNAPIGGLANNTQYYVINQGHGTLQLTQAPVIDLDPAGTSATSQQTLSRKADIQVDLDAINDNTITLDNNGFGDGDSVVYSDEGNTPISGLTNGATYTVQEITTSSFQLLNSGGTVVAVSQGNALGQQSFTDGTIEATLNLGTIHNNALFLGGTIPFSNGQTVAYQSAEPNEANPIGGLSDSIAYTVSPVAGGGVRFFSNGSPVAITAPTAHSLNDFVYFDDVQSFSPTKAVSATDGSISFAKADGFETGDPVVYLNDTAAAPTTVTGLVQNANGTANTTTQVTEADPAIGGLIPGDTYYVVVVNSDAIRLAPTEADALLATPIPLSAPTSGGTSGMQLSANPLLLGINVDASLTDDVKGTTSAGNGANLTSPVGQLLALNSIHSLLSTPGDSKVGLLAAYGAYSASSASTPAKDANGNSPVTSSNDSLSAAGAVAVNVVNHTVDAYVGDLATAGAPAVLTAPASNINVAATIEQTWVVSDMGSVTKPSGGGSQVAVAISVLVFTNSADALIEINTIANASGATNVASTVDYENAFLNGFPAVEQAFANPTLPYSDPQTFWQGFEAGFVDVLPALGEEGWDAIKLLGLAYGGIGNFALATSAASQGGERRRDADDPRRPYDRGRDHGRCPRAQPVHVERARRHRRGPERGVRVYAASGSYPVTVQVEDSDGAISTAATAAAYVSPGGGPSANLPAGLGGPIVLPAPAGIAAPVAPSGPALDFSVATETKGAVLSVTTSVVALTQPAPSTESEPIITRATTVTMPLARFDATSSAGISPAAVSPSGSAAGGSADGFSGMQVAPAPASAPFTPPGTWLLLPRSDSLAGPSHAALSPLAQHAAAHPVSEAALGTLAVPTPSSDPAQPRAPLSAIARDTDPAPPIRLRGTDRIRVATYTPAPPRHLLASLVLPQACRSTARDG